MCVGGHLYACVHIHLYLCRCACKCIHVGPEEGQATVSHIAISENEGTAMEKNKSKIREIINENGTLVYPFSHSNT